MPRFDGDLVETPQRGGPRFAGEPVKLDALTEGQMVTARETGPIEAALVGIGEGMTSTYRGVKQILGLDEEGMKGEASAIRALRAEHPVATTTGSVVGNVADPVNLIPMGKAASLTGLVGRGAVGGAVAGGLGYVDEDAEQTRLGNATMGTLFGGTAGGAIGTGINAVRKLRGKELLPFVERADAGAAIRAGVVPVPEGRATRPRFDGEPITEPAPAAASSLEPAPPAVAREVIVPSQAKAMADKSAQGQVGTVASEQAPARAPKPRFQGEPVAEPAPPAAALEARVEEIASTGSDGAGAGTVSFLGSGQIAQAARGLATMYQRYAGQPMLELAQRNPGSALSGVGGAAAGYQGADDDAPMTEKLGRAAAGFALGVGGAKTLGKIPTSSGSASEVVSRWFVDNHGLPAEYVAAKKGRQILTTQIASDFLDVAKEAEQLGPSHRKLLYNILQGDAPKTGDLTTLNDRSRQTITQWGQRMVDYGLLDADTYRKNMATYLHREYTSKMNPASETGQRVARQVRLLGEELRPRGVLKEVPEREAGEWVDKGWELFGKPQGGRQTVRWQLTKDQRVSMGEIEDASYALARTGQLMSNDIAAFKFFDDVARAPKLASETPVPGWVQVDGGRLPGTKVNRFGNLEGRYVPPEVLKDLTVMDWARSFRVSQNPLAEAFRAYQKLNAWWKTSKTALNPVVHTNNVLSNVLLYDLADADYSHLASAAGEFVKKGTAFKQAQSLGVFDANMAAQELQSITGKADAYGELARVAGVNPVQGALGLTRKLWQHTGGRMIDWYQNEDSVFRLGVFMDRLAKGKTPEEAAKDARRWFIDYDIQAPGINVMRATATPFLAYTYRAVPLLTEAAALRPWKFAKWAAIGWGLNELGEHKGGGDTAKERALMPENQKGNVFGLPVFPPQQFKLPTQLLSEGARAKLGIGDTPQYLDVTRWIPGGDVFDTSGENQFIPGAPAPVQPSFGAMGSIAQAGFGVDAFRGKRLPGLGAGNADDARIKGGYLAQQFLPNNPAVPGSQAQDKVIRSIYGRPAPSGDQLPVWQALAQTFGVKIRPADLNAMQLRAMFETKQDVEALEAQVREAYGGVTAGKMSESAFGKFRDEKIAEAEKKLGLLQRKLNRSSSPEARPQ